MTHTKSVAKGYGKKNKWAIRSKPGAHKLDYGLPLLVIVRDILKYADTATEAKRIIRQGLILVDKKPRKDYQYNVGLMDVVEIPKLKKYYRILPAKKGLILKEINKTESAIKPCKIVGKSVVKKNAVQVNLHDGTNIILDKDSHKINDTLLIELPTRKLKESIEFKNGNIALVVRGRHSGEVDKITEILEGIATRKPLTTVGSLQTLTKYVFVIGKNKSVVAVK